MGTMAVASINLNFSNSDELEDLSSCSVCLTQYNAEDRKPKFLPCHHTFCVKCLRFISCSTVIITCPLCRNTFTCENGVEQLPTNKYAIHIARIATNNNNVCDNTGMRASKLMKKGDDYWCLTCGAIAKLVCFCSNPCHSLVSIGQASLKDSLELQMLVRDMPMKKASAIEKRKTIQAYLSAVYKSLQDSEEHIKDLMEKNETQLSAILALDEQFGGALKSEVSVLTLKDRMTGLILSYNEAIKLGSRETEELELRKSIQFILQLKTSENQRIPVSLLEEGFFTNWTKSENQTSTDRNLLVVAHIVFEMLNKWNIPLEGKTDESAICNSPPEVQRPNSSSSWPRPSSAPAAEEWSVQRSDPSPTREEQLEAADQLSPLTVGQQQAVVPLSTANGQPVRTAPLSYSQVLNLPKPAAAAAPVQTPLPQFPTSASHFAFFTFRFYQKKFVGDVLVKACLPSHMKFLHEMVVHCKTPREFCKKIAKASPGLFLTLQTENAILASGIPSCTTLESWEDCGKSHYPWDVGIIPIVDCDGKIDGWRMVFLVEKFKPQNIEVSMLFGRVVHGKDVISLMASKKAQERYGLLVTVKST